MRNRDPYTGFERFWSKVDVRGPNDCWLWTGCKNVYGAIRIGKMYKAHRVAYRRCVGPIPRGQIVRHKCDVPLCVNPNHLELGTHQENAMDKVDRGRSTAGISVNVGSSHGMAVLCERDILEIREAYANGELQRDIGKRFGIHQVHVSQIVLRKVWKHV